jgi:hypothetical protein
MTGGTVALALVPIPLWIKLMVPLSAFPALFFVYEWLAHGETVFSVESVLHQYALRVARLVWRQEAAEWEHTQDLDIRVAAGLSPALRADTLETPADLHVLNFENTQWLVDNYDLTRWDRIIFDELSLWKGGGQRWKAIRKKVSHARRIGLTGTPASNGLLGVWPMAKLLDESLLQRSRDQFKRAYFYPTDYNQYNWAPLPFAQEQIFEALAPITFRIENDKSEMAELVMNEIKVELPLKAHTLIKRMTRDFIADLEGTELSAASAGVLTGKLQQITNGRVYTEDREHQFVHDAKVKACIELVDSLAGSPCVICYNYQHDLYALREAFPEAWVVGEGDDSEMIERWNAGRIPVLLGHPGAFGHGLNMQRGGHHLIWYGLNWNLDYFEQTIARLWRSGQRNDSVFVHVLVGLDTIDEDIFIALRDKASVQQAMLDYYRSD